MRLPWLRWCAALFPLTFLITANCSDTSAVDRTDRSAPPPDNKLSRAQAWADSLTATMDIPQLIRQVLILPAPDPADTSAAHAFIADARQGLGGVLLPAAPFDDLRGRYAALRDSAPLPIWMAANLDSAWLHQHQLPSLIQLGASADDSLAFTWGQTIGAALAHSGAELAFYSAGRLIRAGHTETDALGDDPEHVHAMSQAMLRGLKSQGVHSVLRPLPALMPEFPGGPGLYRRSLLSLRKRDLLPFYALANTDSIFAQSAFMLAPKIDSALAPYSRAINKSLRGKPEDLVFSPALLGRDSNATAEAALKCLQAGQDMLLLKADGDATWRYLASAVEDGKFPVDSLRKRAARVLTQKALRQRQAPSVTNSIPHAQALKALGLRIAEAGIVVLRDNRGVLPLKGGLGNLQVALLAAGAPVSRSIVETFSVYAPVYASALDTHATARKALIDIAQKHKLVVVPLYPGSKFLNERSQTLPALRAALTLLDSAGRLVVLNFGAPKMLEGLEQLNCVVQAWSDDAQVQVAAAQLVLGAKQVNGRIPLQCGPLFCHGDGLPRGGRQRLAYALPEAVGADPRKLMRIDSIVEHAIRMGAFPGCQVLAAKDGQVFFHKAYGYHDYGRSQPCRLDDLYDIASVTKIAATTLMAMHAWERDTLHLDAPLKYYLHELDSSFITLKDITPQELMLHKAGLPPGLPIYQYCVMNDSADSVRKAFYSNQPDSLHGVRITNSLYFNPNYLDSLWLRVRRTSLDTSGEYVYSDMSMFLMQRTLERITSTPLNRFVDSVFYRPMGLRTMCYHPTDRFELDRIAPTEIDRWWRNQQVHGYVHDPSTALFGGVGGQAGLFSNAWDLAAVMQMLLNGGDYAGMRLLEPHTVAYFTNRQPESHRGLGFDMQRVNPTPGEGMVASSAHPATFGHLGFTGTCAWADPVNDIVFVFLSNRVHPTSDNKRINEMRIRQTVQQAVYEALGLAEIPSQDCYME